MKEEANWNKQETLDLQVKNSYINIVLKFGKFGSTVRIKCMAVGILIVVLAVFLIYM